ncbi:MAG: endonuclease III [Ruminococcaceae bacterium]|nr:endonuclease III [Oscillospiraceae bacterium]
MTKKDRFLKIKEIFDTVYHDAICSLNYRKPHELLISTILAAQCTDKRVNQVTVSLYKKYPDIEAFAKADYNELCEDIKSTGFFRNKAKNIILCAQKIVDEFDGKVPEDFDSLTSLAGVGRKTAGVVLGDAFNNPHLVIDTHAKRLAKRMGFTKFDDPYKVELDLAKIVPKKDRSQFCHQLVFHGRAICDSRKPKCDVCPIAHLCPKNIGKK